MPPGLVDMLLRVFGNNCPVEVADDFRHNTTTNLSSTRWRNAAIKSGLCLSLNLYSIGFTVRSSTGYYVVPTCLDTNDSLSLITPVKTIQPPHGCTLLFFGFE